MKKAGAIAGTVAGVVIIYLLMTIFMPIYTDIWADSSAALEATTANISADFPGAIEVVDYALWFYYILPALFGIIVIILILRSQDS